ncbi:MAG: PKD domain-containing protein [Bacteroidetes bacterium]|nr:PKD domain-containing protein [Bacteroidota bacterium]
MTSISTSITLGIPNPITVSSHLACASDTLQFGITGVSQFSSYTWNFGDGTPTTNSAAPTHCYGQGGTFVVTLNATTTTGCNYVYTDTITTEFVIPSFVVNGVTEKCNSLYATFTNTSTGGVSYLWDFNDVFSSSDTSTSFSPTHYFHNVGVYNVTLTVYGQSCVATQTFPGAITIHQSFPNFSFTQSSNCFPMTVQFTDLTINAGATVWNWNFGNGQTSNVQNPVVTYTQPPSGNITLNVTDSNGCVGNKSKPNIFFLEAHFATNNTGGCRPYTVAFSDSSDSSAVAWEWFFGDGTTSTLQNPTHTYTQDSSYTVTLVTTFASGCKDTIVMPAFINVSSPHANFTSATQAGCAPVLVQFNNTSINGVTYYWDFGDGSNSNNIAPSHVYNIPGYYTVTLIAYNGTCSDTTVKTDYIYIPGTYSYFTLASTLNCLGNYTCFVDSSLNATSWQWNFGDGYTDTVQNPCHLYADTGSYIVSLIAYDSLGCQSYYTFPTLIDVHPNAVAAGTVSDTLGCNPFTVNFTETATYEVAYVWHFGDGDSSTLANPTHTYQNAGIFYPYLVAFNTNGCSDTSEIIGPIHVVQTPNAQFTPSISVGCNALNSTMLNTSTDTTVSIYNWTFGNGVSSNILSPTTVYPDSGIYTVTLVVTNEGLCSDTALQQITVHLTPTAIASTTDTLGCSPYIATFNNTSVYATNYLWHFGDGQTSTNANPTHTYISGGVYNVYLVATNQFGCSDTFYFTNPITVLQTPSAQFSASSVTGCTPFNIQLSNQSTDTINVSYNWNFGNGTTSTSVNPTAAYPDSGVFNIELIAMNFNGCADTAAQTATIYLTPTAIASTTDTLGCSPFSVSLNNNSIYATQFNWNFGDNNSSNAASPAHIYLSGGIYYPTLIATNQFGCSDTIVFLQPITVLQTPNAQFSTNVNAGCTPLLITTSNQTTDTISPTYNWNFGNGQTSNSFNPNVTYTDSALSNISLIVSNANGCSDTANSMVDVHLSPTAIANTTDTSGCSPYQVIFNNNSIAADSYLWNFGNGQTSTDPSPVYNYTIGGNYQVTLIASNSFGCIDTLIISPSINVKQSPTANFSVAQAAQCSGSTFNFQNTSSNLSNPTYNWLIGATDTSTAANPGIALLGPGFYSVSLTVTNDNGCADSLTQINYLQVYDTLPPAADPILSVSVLNNTQTEITWANSAALDLGAYKVWRLDAASGNYINIYTDNNPVSGTFNPDSKYTDSGLNTLQNTYTYKVQTLDRCAYAIPLTSLIAHTTVNVTARTSGTNIKVEWTPYIGCAVNTYEINRVEVNNGSSVLIGTVPGIITEFTDTTLDCPIEYSYKITATDLCGNPYLSLSDTSIAIPENELANQQAIMSHSTVIQNNFVLTEWAEPQLAPHRVNGYNILRSKDTLSANYVLIATLPSNTYSYEDYDVDIMEQNYFYKVEVINDCNLAGLASTNSSSILLQSRWMYTHSTLWLTEYDKWDSGVDKYEIEKFNWDTQQWELIKTVPGNQTSTDVSE